MPNMFEVGERLHGVAHSESDQVDTLLIEASLPSSDEKAQYKLGTLAIDSKSELSVEELEGDERSLALVK